MSGNNTKKTPISKDRYWNGVFTGVFIGCFILSVFILVFVRLQGLRVVINPSQLALMVKNKVQTEARKDIPQLLEDFKHDLPQEIGNHFDEIDQLKIGFGNSEIKLPTEISSSIKLEFNRVVESAIINTLNSYDTGKYEAKIAANAYEMVDKMLRQEIIGKTYLIQSFNWLTVPVKIVSTSKESANMDI